MRKYLFELNFNRFDGYVLTTGGVLIGTGMLTMGIIVVVIGSLISAFFSYKYKKDKTI